MVLDSTVEKPLLERLVKLLVDTLEEIVLEIEGIEVVEDTALGLDEVKVVDDTRLELDVVDVVEEAALELDEEGSISTGIH